MDMAPPTTKTVVAPPGTMGVSFVRQPRGHVVVGVREDSPLVGQLELGSRVCRGGLGEEQFAEALKASIRATLPAEARMLDR